MSDHANFLPSNPQHMPFVNHTDLSYFMPACQLQYVGTPVFRSNEDDLTREDSGSISTLHTASLNSRASGNVVTSTAAVVQGKVLKFPGGCNIVKSETPPAVSPQPAGRKESALDPRKYKTHLCRNWLRTGVCAFAEGCVYAHGSQELRKESENISVLSLLEKLASTSTAPNSKEATTIENVSRRKSRRHSRRAKGKTFIGNQSTSKFELVKNEGTSIEGDETVFDLPLNGVIQIETDDDEGSDSELVSSPNRNLSSEYSNLGIQNDLRKAASLPVNDVEGHRLLAEQFLTSHSLQPLTQRPSMVAIPPPAAQPKPETEVDIRKMSSVVKESLARIQSLENEVALLKSCLAELLKGCQEKSQSIPTNQPSSVLLATITKPIVQYSTATSHSLFNFPALGQS
jgi:hypothetical protein